MKLKKVKLGQLVKQIRGVSYKPSDISQVPLDGYVPIIKANNITESGFDGNNLIYLSKTKIKETQFIRKGDIVLAASSGSKKVIGKNIQFENDFEGAFGAFCKGIRPCKILFPGYIKHFFKTTYYRRTIENVVQGVNINNLKNAHINDLIIPVPEVSDDQIRIATLLSRAEELITKRKESIRLLDKLLTNTFLEMFDSGAKDLNDWPVREIQSLAAKKKRSMRTGPFGSNLLHKEFTTDGDVAVLGIDNAVNNRFEWNQKRFISRKKYDSLKNYTIHPRDVIITIMGTTGRSAVVPDNIPLAINTKHLAAITLDESEANPYFLSFSIYSNPYILRQLRSQNRGAIMKGLNLGIIKRLKIKLPPIELQNHFEHVLKKVESLKTKYETSLQELENLYGSLSQRAFRGKLDVSKVPIHHELVVDDVVQVQEVDSPTIVIKKGGKFELNIKSIQKLISGNFTKPFTFAMLWEQINTMLLDQEADEEKETPAEGEELHTYETVQQLIYTMLNGSNPFLKQTFSQDGEQKEIVLELAR